MAYVILGPVHGILIDIDSHLLLIFYMPCNVVEDGGGDTSNSVVYGEKKKSLTNPNAQLLWDDIMGKGSVGMKNLFLSVFLGLLFTTVVPL